MPFFLALTLRSSTQSYCALPRTWVGAGTIAIIWSRITTKICSERAFILTIIIIIRKLPELKRENDEKNNSTHLWLSGISGLTYTFTAVGISKNWFQIRVRTWKILRVTRFFFSSYLPQRTNLHKTFIVFVSLSFRMETTRLSQQTYIMKTE